MKLLKVGAVPLLALFMLASVSVALAENNTTNRKNNNEDQGSEAAKVPMPDTSILANGTVKISGAKITAISGSSFNASQTWGSYSLNWVINTNGSTKLQARSGGALSLSDFAVGDMISFSGSLDQSQTQGVVTAKVVRDSSVQKQNASISGTVSSVNSAATSFVLSTKGKGNVTVLVSAGTSICKGSATTTFASLAVGQTIKANGVWDSAANTLQAQTVTISTDQGLLNKRIFEGTLGTLATTSLPTTFTFMVGNTTYTVNVASNTALLSNSWNPILLSQVHASDKIRIYGAVEVNNMTTIDAYIIRDVSVH